MLFSQEFRSLESRSLDDTPSRMAVQRGRDVHIWRLSVVWLFGRLVVWGGV